jgi:hypothetical protein
VYDLVRTHPTIDFELRLWLAHAARDDGEYILGMILDILERMVKRGR